MIGSMVATRGRTYEQVNGADLVLSEREEDLDEQPVRNARIDREDRIARGLRLPDPRDRLDVEIVRPVALV